MTCSSTVMEPILAIDLCAIIKVADSNIQYNLLAHGIVKLTKALRQRDMSNTMKI